MRLVIERIEEGVLAFLLAFMTLLTFIQVVLRYVFNTGLLWSLEATTYAFAALVLVGMSYGIRTKSHIAVDLLVKNLPLRLRNTVALCAVVICLIYTGLMFFGAYDLVDGLFALGNRARDVAAPKWLLTTSLPLGFLLLAFRFIEAGLKVMKGDSAVLVTGIHDDNEQLLVAHTGDQENK
ncbi:MAG: C4-dicarboxylate transporter DctQ subunit [Porticoccus sp.]|jgi:C4-dicarboxylate transporter DctQ subunit